MILLYLLYETYDENIWNNVMMLVSIYCINNTKYIYAVFTYEEIVSWDESICQFHQNKIPCLLDI